VLTKQHVIVDVVTGLIMAVVCWILAPVVAAMIC
jgi:membrane-associated phospholipid phosphatase